MGLMAGLASGIGSVGSALLGSKASKQASQQQFQMGLLGMMQQQKMFDQANGALSPYYTAGQNVLPTLQSLITPGAAQTETLSKLPGFQFASQWGNLSATNALAAQGLGGSTGPLAKAISDYNNGLAQTYWGQDVGALQNFANMGSSAASSLGGVASNFANMIGNTAQGLGNAQASGTLGSANALSGGFQGLGNAALLSSIMPNSTGNGFTLGGNPFSGLYGGVKNAFLGQG